MSINDYQLDALKELINIGVGQAAGMLNQMLDSHVQLQVPAIKIISQSDIHNNQMGEFEFSQDELSAVQLTFKGPFSGTASLLFPPDSAAKLVNILTGEDINSVADLDAIKIGALTEIGNIVLNGIMGSISNMLEQNIKYIVPTYMEDKLKNLLLLNEINDPNITILLARTRFTVAKLHIEGDILLLFEVGSFEILLSAIEAQYTER